MKSTIKIFAIFAMVVAFAVGAKAQVTKDITGKATVMAQITMGTPTALDFKNVTPNNAKTVSVTGVVAPATTATGGETAGSITINKGPSTQVTLKFTVLPPYLTTGTGSTAATQLIIDSYVARLRTTDATPATAAWASPGTDITTDSGTDHSAFFAATSFAVDLGATVRPIEGQTAGYYTGTITLSAEYN